MRSNRLKKMVCTRPAQMIGYVDREILADVGAAVNRAAAGRLETGRVESDKLLGESNVAHSENCNSSKRDLMHEEAEGTRRVQAPNNGGRDWPNWR